jgi:hypothetical protein
VETLKINFGHFWPSFDKQDNYFTRVLSKRYALELSEDPDYYFFTHPYDGKLDYLKYTCHRIFLGWENQRADWNICDYVLDSNFEPGNPRHKRFPIWAGWNLQKLVEPKQPGSFAQKKKFCCMLVSNGKAKERINFFHVLNKYKKVDSGGKYLNNVGYPVENKMEFIKDYKFVLSFENSSRPGYTTEKLIEPMLVGSIPIYWGNPAVEKDFNTKSFIHITGKENFSQALEKIIALDNDEGLLREMEAEPWFNNNLIPQEMSNDSLLQFLEFVIEDSKSKRPVATDWYKTQAHRVDLLKQKVEGVVKHRLGIQTGFR